ncbi:molybdopterin converting factor subunit 1 [Leeia aquatica]|uniref:Molybdopterin converting factor subunit 1 n=1 Tax=Leeia aquatica TaxID=2725557 RepID=A0A847SF54_9NEIS|nr:molybdopterin converting factor subunit 1 [Leeia aquatica]NLR74582.1 molybdopterin converting factor subunit 1 [Leeia aquatica]
MKTLKLLYFARLREEFQRAEESVVLPDTVATVNDLVAWLASRGGVWQDEFSGQKLFRVAIDQVLADGSAALPAQGEIALFPPVTGG